MHNGMRRDRNAVVQAANFAVNGQRCGYGSRDIWRANHNLGDVRFSSNRRHRFDKRGAQRLCDQQVLGIKENRYC